MLTRLSPACGPNITEFTKDSLMRNYLSIALLASLTLAGCNRSEQVAPASTPNATTPAATAPNQAKDAITGVLRTRDGALAELPAGAVVTVRLLDGTRSDAPPAEVLAKPVVSTGTLPMPYSLTFDPKTVERMATYLIDANITLNGQLLFLTPDRLPVLTQGAGNTMDIPLIQGLVVTAPVTEADDAKRLYADLEAQLGAMKRLTGDRIVGDITIGWDAFADRTGVRVVRENVDYGDAGGKASLKYAYRDGKLWVAVKEQGASKTMIVWDKFGNLLLREVTSDGETSEATDAVASELKRGSEEIYKIAAAKL